MKPGHSELFTLRVSAEPLNDGQVEWRGSVRHVLTGEVRYFRNWPMLVECLANMLCQVETPRTGLSDPNDVETAPRGE